MGEPSNEPKKAPIALQVDGAWKIYGPEKDVRKLLQSENRHAPKSEILEKTGCVLGLRNISFEVRKGEFFVLMGLSGSGKSTLVRCLNRLVNPTQGRILVGDEDICTFNRDQLIEFRRHTISMVFQHFGLLPHYTVLDNVAYGLKIRGMGKEERHACAQAAIETVGLKGWEDYLPASLSGGMQQRVGMARALAQEPEILLLDEPFSGLDPLIRRQMQDELVDLQCKLQKTMVFVTHDLHEALKLADRIAIMKDGEIIQLGTPEDIVAEPANDYVSEFIQDASPAKVLTAGRIMEQPDLLLYEWQGPKATRALFRSTKQDSAFFLTRDKKLMGLVARADLRDLLRRNGTNIQDILVTDLPTCSPDTLIEDLFSLATSSPYPISVIDENEKFQGVIFNVTILDNLVQDAEGSDDV